MVLNNILNELDENERKRIDVYTASEYFTSLYYSLECKSVLDKIDSNEEISLEEWNYLIKRLFIVTCKAIVEEDKKNIINKLDYLICRIGMFLFKKDGKAYNECYKMFEFIDSIDKDKEINLDLLYGLDEVNKRKDSSCLAVLLDQHREASLFRDKKDDYVMAYRDSYTGYISDSERSYINYMERSYLREKGLVKEYK